MLVVQVWILLGLISGIKSCDEILDTCCFLVEQHSILVAPPALHQKFPPDGVAHLQTNRSAYKEVYFQTECKPVWGAREDFALLPNLVTFYFPPRCVKCLPDPPTLKNVTFVGLPKCQLAPTLCPAHNSTVSKGSKVGVIVGGTLGAVGFCVALAVVIFVVKKKMGNATTQPLVAAQDE